MFIPDKTPIKRKHEKTMLNLYLFNKCGWLGTYGCSEMGSSVVMLLKLYNVFWNYN